jgi:acetyltransferase-like isoleucine patch superfamily enzyme
MRPYIHCLIGKIFPESLIGMIILELRQLSSRCINKYYQKAISSCGVDVMFYPGVTIENPQTVIIGNHTHIGENCHLRGGGRLVIGDWCQVANHSIIITGSHPINGDKYYGNWRVKDVIIGNNVWIASGARILPGVEIGDNSVIAAGAVVTKSVGANLIVAGVPARVIGHVPIKDKQSDQV